MSGGLRDEEVIRTPDRRLRVFVSSTLGELAGERRAVSRAISALRLTPVMFEAGARPYPPASETRGPRPLPVSATSLLGREEAIGEVAGLVESPGVRLVTLTGPGGVGKTRLALAVGERLRDRFSVGTAFVPLDTITDPGLVLAAIGRAAGADMAGTGPPVEALAEAFGDGAWLLIVDNLEQVIGVAPDLGELLARCPGVVMLATSRTVLGLRGEREYPVPPLPAPTGPAASAAEVAARPRWRCSWTGPARCGPALP